MLSLDQLRQETYTNWEVLHFCKASYLHGPLSWDVDDATAPQLPYTNKYFKADIRKQFGDLRKRCTWKQAAIYHAALSMMNGDLESWQILCWVTIPNYLGPDLIMEHYPTELHGCLFQMPQFIDILKTGLEQIYQRPDLSNEKAQIETSTLPVSTALTLNRLSHQEVYES